VIPFDELAAGKTQWVARGRRAAVLLALGVLAAPLPGLALEPAPSSTPEDALPPPPPKPAAARDDASSSPASTTEVATGSRSSLEEQRSWYGWQTLATDLGAVALVAAALAVADGGEPPAALGYAGLGLYVLGGPVVHLAHRNPGRAAGSLALRVGGPILGGAVGCAADGNDGGVGCLGGLALGVFLGTLSAVVIDAAALAHEPVSKPTARWRAPKPRVSVAADLTLTRNGGAVFGLSGSF
jgi:hypothetical protein